MYKKRSGLSLSLVKSRALAIKEGLVQERKEHLLTGPLFLDIGSDLLRRKNEAILTSVAQFDCNNTDSITQLADKLVEPLVLGTIGWLLTTTTYRTSNPLSRVDTSMVQHSRLSGTIITPEVKTVDVALLVRFARGHNLGVVGKLRLQVPEVVDVILIVVELIEPRIVIGLTLPLLAGDTLTSDGSA
ncbi:hypothetical protein HG530_000541 [Fusarium avenaceum]|nr:hypothetical protein HG530_000541 [Fusarium avenaceum]